MPNNLVNPGKSISVTYQCIGLAAMWLASVVLQTWSNTSGPLGAGRWAIMISGAAAAWTAVFGVRKVVHTVARGLLVRMQEMLDEQITDATDPIADTVMRRLELRELEQQVAQLVPRQPTR